MSYADIGEAVVGLIVFIAFCLFCGQVGRWRHLWKYNHNPIYRERDDRYQAGYRAVYGPSALTSTTHAILQFIADGGEQGRMLSELVLGETSVRDREWSKGWQDLRSAGFVENVMATVDQPARIRVTKAGGYALAATFMDFK